MKKIGVWAVLALLIVVPILNWRIGAVIWMCAWIIYLLQISLNRPERNQPESSDDSINGQ